MSRRASYVLRIASLITIAFASHAGHAEVRLGWQTPWATQGQIVMALKHTNIPELLGLRLNYVGFAYGAPLNQAALAGQIDVLLTADQPGLVLLARSAEYRIVARLMYNRVCLYVPPESPITGVSDLGGASIAGPAGSAAERFARITLGKAKSGTDPAQFGQLDMPQQSALINQHRGASRWGTFDAFYGFDPFPAMWTEQKLIRNLACGRVVSVVIASRDMLTNRRPELVQFLQSLALGWDSFRRDPIRFNRLFTDTAKITVSDSALDEASAIEPNFRAPSFDKLRLTLNEDDRRALEEVRDFLAQQKILPANLDLANLIDQSALDEAAQLGLAALTSQVR